MKRLVHLSISLGLGLVCLCATWALWHHEQVATQKNLWSNFDFALRQSANRIEQRMAAFEQLLRGAQGLFDASDLVERDDFRVYVEVALSGADFSGLQAFAFTPLIPGQRLENFVHAQRRMGQTSYRVFPEGEREWHAPVTYIEPFSRLTERAMGFDALSDSARREAMFKARDSGAMVMTRKTRLVTEAEGEAQAAFVLFLPLYAKGKPLGNVAQRREQLTGWVFATFRMGDLMSGLYGEGTPGLDLRVYDGVELSDAALMYRSGPDAGHAALPGKEAHEYIAMANHTWTLVAGMRPEFEQRFSSNSASIIAVSGVGLSLLLSLLSWQLLTARARAFGRAEAMTRELRESEERMRHMAQHDALTGLPNRRTFRDRLEQDVKKSKRDGLPVAVLFIDLDQFKEVNDTLGHDQGDVLLKEAAQRICHCVREADTVARLGGDEFTVILAELHDLARVEAIAQHINQALAAPFELRGEQAYVSASIGITLYPHDATEIDDLLKQADQAMYVAKDAGRNCFSFFTPALQVAAVARMRLTNDLRGALANEELRLYFQPVVDLASGRIHKAEALLRWEHPTRGMVSPAEFIPLAEASGLIHDIGEWVFQQAAQWVKRWREQLDPYFQVAVNQSPIEFQRQGRRSALWLAHLKALGLPGGALVVEITEGLLLDASPGVTEQLLEFRDAGVEVALDDFGTGYSSLSYIQKFDIDYLKIDQSFVRNLRPGARDVALCKAIIVMAHELGIKVIAEGVETTAQRELLTAAGCDYAQGYLFAKPLPAEAFDALLVRQRDDALAN
nr:EAL domain-containing protein [uncultured Roseateles sp.]